jgi:hypothetical protein
VFLLLCKLHVDHLNKHLIKQVVFQRSRSFQVTIYIMALQKHQVRQVYLITYSQADVRRFPSRDSFAKLIVEAFEQTPASIIQWVCSKETHQDGGIHFHVAIKLDRLQRWLTVKKYLEDNYFIVVNFSGTHVNYYSAWVYVTKEDNEYLESKDHPLLRNGLPPRTMQASQASSQRAGNGEPTAKKRKQTRLSGFEVGEICLDANVKNRLELLALANRMKIEGKTDLAEFIYKRGRKAVDEVISTAWEMAEAEATLERAKLRRLDILKETLATECIEACNGRWVDQAKDILARNSISHDDFSTSIVSLLQLGRGKYRNILITGPTNCGKTFILQPLTTLYKCFSNPATATYAWIGAEDAEVILLNDFRWSPQVNTSAHCYVFVQN